MSWYESCIKPIIEVATLCGVIAALLYQNETIKKQKEEFDRQKEKDRKSEFQSLLNMTLNEYNLFMEQFNGSTDNGRKGYKQSVIDNLDFLFTNYHESHRAFSHLVVLANDEDPTRINSDISDHIIIGRTGHHEDFLRPYLFLIENSLLILDNHTIIEDVNKDFNEKKVYFKYFFSKLNDFEIHLIMIYCLNNRGNLVKEIIEKYSLFEDKRIFSLFFDLKNLFKESAFKSN